MAETRIEAMNPRNCDRFRALSSSLDARLAIR
jgi:hypothetical protein